MIPSYLNKESAASMLLEWTVDCSFAYWRNTPHTTRWYKRMFRDNLAYWKRTDHTFIGNHAFFLIEQGRMKGFRLVSEYHIAYENLHDIAFACSSYRDWKDCTQRVFETGRFAQKVQELLQKPFDEENLLRKQGQHSQKVIYRTVLHTLGLDGSVDPARVDYSEPELPHLCFRL